MNILDIYPQKNILKYVFHPQFRLKNILLNKFIFDQKVKNHGLSRGPSRGSKSILTANCVAFQILVADLKDIYHCESSQHLFLCTLND